MTELRIYELLSEISNSNNVLGTDDHYNLLPETVNLICKTITGMLYDTLKDKNSVVMSKRIDLIQLIRKWCAKDENHFYPDTNNYTCFLKCLKIPNIKPNEIEDFVHEELKNCDSFHDDHLGYVQFYKDFDQRNLEKRQRLGAILDADQRILNEIEFTVVKKDVCSENIEEFLSCLFKIASNKNNVIEEIIRKRTGSALHRAAMESPRAKRISFVYALLNLPRNVLTTSLVISIVNAISAESNIDQDEVNLLEYIIVKAGNLQLDAEFQVNLLRKFPFIYERPLILLCRDALLGNISDIIQEKNTCLSKVIKLSKGNHWLKMRILLLLYELFALSNYNIHILNVIKKFK